MVIREPIAIAYICNAEIHSLTSACTVADIEIGEVLTQTLDKFSLSLHVAVERVARGVERHALVKVKLDLTDMILFYLLGYNVIHSVSRIFVCKIQRPAVKVLLGVFLDSLALPTGSFRLKPKTKYHSALANSI